MTYTYAVDIINLPDPLEAPKLMDALLEIRKQKIRKCKQLQARKQSLGAGLLLGFVLKQHGLQEEEIKFGFNGKP